MDVDTGAKIWAPVPRCRNRVTVKQRFYVDYHRNSTAGKKLEQLGLAEG